MSAIRSVLDDLRSEDVRLASDEELGDDLCELERVSRVVESERARRLAEVDRRGTWSVDGHLSVVSWLAARLRVGFGRATQQVKLARALREMPMTSRAFGAGDVSSEAIGLLVQAREVAPEAFGDSEEMLVGAAATLSAHSFRQAVAYWREAADADRAEERARRAYEGRHLHVSPTFAGTVRIDGDLDPESGQTVITAIRSMQDAWCRVEDRRTAPQRRADALTELCRTWLDRSDRPEVAGQRPHVMVSVDLQTLQGRLGRVCELADAGPLIPEAARRPACDASVSRVITMGASEPLDVGRRTPVVPPGMRRALVVRDRGCRFPGCGRPQAWCDAHHVSHWADGGETALRNLVLLCRPHHRAVHEDFRVKVMDGQPVFSRSDGLTLEDRAPPQGAVRR
jgi:hypothetical protein